MIALIILFSLFYSHPSLNEHDAFVLGARTGLHYYVNKGNFPSDKWLNKAFLEAQKSDKEWNQFLVEY